MMMAGGDGSAAKGLIVDDSYRVLAATVEGPPTPEDLAIDLVSAAEAARESLATWTQNRQLLAQAARARGFCKGQGFGKGRPRPTPTRYSSPGPGKAGGKGSEKRSQPPLRSPSPSSKTTGSGKGQNDKILSQSNPYEEYEEESYDGSDGEEMAFGRTLPEPVILRLVTCFG